MTRQVVDVFRHEAGHMVVAKLLGFETQEVVYGTETAGAKLIIEPNLPDTQSVAEFIRKRLVILHAGVLAESINGGKTNSDRAIELIRDKEGADDYSKVRELTRVLAGVCTRKPRVSSCTGRRRVSGLGEGQGVGREVCPADQRNFENVASNVGGLERDHDHSTRNQRDRSIRGAGLRRRD